MPRHLLAARSLSDAVLLSRRRLLAGLAGAGGAAARLAAPPPGYAESEATRAQAATAARVADWDVPGGHFYTQGAPEDAPPDTGFVVANAFGLQLWRDYQALGGPAQLGFPISSHYDAGGVTYQVMEGAVLRWHAPAGHADVFPIFWALAEAGLDEWLAARGIPPASPHLLEDPDLPAETRLSWLTHPVLRTAYLGAGEADAQARFGLPMGEPERFGPYLAQRFDKAVLQLWLDDVPGQPAPGAVTLVQAGRLLVEAGLVPEDALVPQPAPAPRPVLHTLPGATSAHAAPVAAPGAGKYILVSLSRQWWYAFQDGQQVYNGPVTTGRPELPTPVGRFTVLSRHSPYVFVSPWPRGSPFWYETSPCSFALRITGNGVYLHDAPWRPFYGPGTNVPHIDPDGVWRTGSHGCINLPYAAAAWLWTFAPVGTPVDVIV